MKCGSCNRSLAWWHLSCRVCRHSAWKAPQIALRLILALAIFGGAAFIFDLYLFGDQENPVGSSPKIDVNIQPSEQEKQLRKAARRQSQ